MPPVEEESPPLHAGWGWGSCVATTLRSGKRVKERRRTGGMRKERGPRRGRGMGKPPNSRWTSMVDQEQGRLPEKWQEQRLQPKKRSRVSQYGSLDVPLVTWWEGSKRKRGKRGAGTQSKQRDQQQNVVKDQACRKVVRTELQGRWS